MKQNLLLTIASVLSILFMTFHLTDDIVRGMEPGTLPNLGGVLIFVVWLLRRLRRIGPQPMVMTILPM